MSPVGPSLFSIIFCDRFPYPHVQNLEAAVPINGWGLAASFTFWLVMFKVCQFVSVSLAGAKYTSLTSLVKSDWDNYAWSSLHGVVAFLVRACVCEVPLLWQLKCLAAVDEMIRMCFVLGFAVPPCTLRQ